MHSQKTRFFMGLILGVILVSLSVLIPQFESVAKNDRSATGDVSAFIKAGCVQEGESLNCSKINLEEKFSCEKIIPPSDALSRLSPALPIAECTFINRNASTTTEGISRKGCRLPLYNKYIVLTADSQFKEIGTKEAFQKLFAPVEKPEEALSFAVALTQSYPRYKITVPKEFRVFVPKIKDTFVKKIANGYQVHLFDYQVCGCGPHPHYTVDYTVTKTGEVTETSREKIYEDPKQDGLCVD
ncbi:hypothetical protein [Microcoleus sp. FACHB-672]|uniref:hypothetical protein n=1 Tax=Microcoleus sp. FACHB-672 TaxID=2692825 RepID=UPI001682F4B9|nr:hypothetical protein [Microcoleus sp. FACHB-672]MBD2039676.1 hypothetical protein [Microcoleus sp. FACHB-672]